MKHQRYHIHKPCQPTRNLNDERMSNKAHHRQKGTNL